MPCWKYKPPIPRSKARDFWGDENKGQRLDLLITRKYGSHFGARKAAAKALFPGRTIGSARRLLNMYITGERNIPDDFMKTLRAKPDFTIKKVTRTKGYTVAQIADLRREKAKGRIRREEKHRDNARIAADLKAARRGNPSVFITDDDDNIDPLS